MVSVNVIHHVYLLKWEILLYCWVQLLATNIYVSKGSGHDPLLSSHCHMLLLLPTTKVQVQNEYIIKKEKKKEKKKKLLWDQTDCGISLHCVGLRLASLTY